MGEKEVSGLFGESEEKRAHLSDEDQNDEDTTEDRSPDSTHGAEGQFLDGVTCRKKQSARRC